VIFPLFSTPVYFVEDEAYQFGDDELSFIKNSEFGCSRTNSLSKSNQVLESTELSRLKDFIHHHVDTYMSWLVDVENSDYKFEISSSWITKTEPSESHGYHKHLASLISGVVSVTPGNTTTFSRENTSTGPFPFFPLAYRNSELPFSENVNFYQKNPGSILLFPSSTFHSVPTHELEEDRYSISFNVFPRGTFYYHPEQTVV